MTCHRVMIGKTPAILCTGTYHEPTDKSECPEAVNSFGRACKKCDAQCYRAGWEKSQVDRDNKRLCGKR